MYTEDLIYGFGTGSNGDIYSKAFQIPPFITPFRCFSSLLIKVITLIYLIKILTLFSCWQITCDMIWILMYFTTES